MKTNWTALTVFCIAIAFISIGIYAERQRNKNIITADEIKPGATFLYSLAFDTLTEHDPFETYPIDTVVVLNIKNNYVQYQKYNGIYNIKSSGKLAYFKDYIKPVTPLIKK